MDTNEGTSAIRRKLLRFIALSSTLPGAVFLEGCATTPTPRSGDEKGGMESPLRGGLHVRRSTVKDFESGSPVKWKVKWDFDRLIRQVEDELREIKDLKYKTTGDVATIISPTEWPQVPVRTRRGRQPDRKLGIIGITIDWEAAKGNGSKVGVMKIRGCMLRNHDDEPVKANNCEDAKRKADCHSQDHKMTDHLVYSSSSSSSSWA